MDALEVIFSRRSIRQYTNEAVSEDSLKTILEAAMAAPSANNRQPWHFIVVRDREKMEGIMAAHPYTKMLKQAPVAIIVVGDTATSPSYFQQDCAAAIENILLAAKALDLGTVWCGIYPNEERVAALAGLFSIPDPFAAIAVIAVGHPAEEKEPADRYEASRVHHDTW